MEGALSTNSYLMDYSNSTGKSYLNETPQVSYVRNENLAKVEIAIQAIIFSLAVLGNGLVILILLKSPKRRKKLSRMNILIFHLSIADLFVAFFNVLPQLIWDVTFTFYGGDFLCRSVKYFQVVAMYASSYVLITTAIDRYIALCHPLVSQRWSNGRVHIMAGIAWLISLIFSTPQVIIFGYREVAPGSGIYNCWAVFNPQWTMQLYVTLFCIAIYIVPTLILIFAYGKICYVVWRTTGHQESSFRNKNGREVTSNGHSTNGEVSFKIKSAKIGSESQVLVTPRVHVRSLNKSKVKTVKLTLVVILCYIICWSPFFISQLWAAWDVNAPFEATGMVIIMLLASLNSCTNPWIYLAFTDNLRRHLLSLFPCTAKGTSKRSSRSTDSRYGSSFYYSTNSRTDYSKTEVSMAEKENGIPLVKL